MTIYYVEEPFYNSRTAGSKSRNDVNSLFKSWKYQSIQKALLQPQLKFNAEDLIFIQYSFVDPWQQTLFEILSVHQIKTVLFINDIVSLQQNYDKEALESELSLFNKATFLIVHTEKMKQWLKKHGVTTKMISLDVYDYLIDPVRYEEIKCPSFSHTVVFAGNLNPILREFLYAPNYIHDFQLYLYGPEVEGTLQTTNTTYFDSFPPEEIPNHLSGSFGLLWNGSNYQTCDGHIGYYSMISLPHKLSLYLLTKKPIICWENAAEADLVVKSNLGFTVASLTEIDEKLDHMTPEQYNQMVENVCRYSERVKSGYFLERAIKLILAQL